MRRRKKQDVRLPAACFDGRQKSDTGMAQDNKDRESLRRELGFEESFSLVDLISAYGSIACEADSVARRVGCLTTPRSQVLKLRVSVAVKA